MLRLGFNDSITQMSRSRQLSMGNTFQRFQLQAIPDDQTAQQWRDRNQPHALAADTSRSTPSPGMQASGPPCARCSDPLVGAPGRYQPLGSPLAGG